MVLALIAKGNKEPFGRKDDEFHFIHNDFGLAVKYSP